MAVYKCKVECTWNPSGPAVHFRAGDLVECDASARLPFQVIRETVVDEKGKASIRETKLEYFEKISDGPLEKKEKVLSYEPNLGAAMAGQAVAMSQLAGK